MKKKLYTGLAGLAALAVGTTLHSASVERDVIEQEYIGVQEPCQDLSRVDQLTCDLNEAGYDVNSDTVQNLVKTLYFEADPTMGQHEYDSIATSIRNQYDTAPVWETMDDHYPKGSTIDEILEKGAYYGNRGNQQYFQHTDDFKVLDMQQDRVDMAVDAVYRTFMVDRSELLHSAQVYKHNDKSSQVWHNREFGYMQNGDERDIHCRTEHVGKIAGVEYKDTGDETVESSHTFYEITCDMNGNGTYTSLLQ